MSMLKALVLKEWGEIRIFFVVAIFVFLGLPLIGGLERRFQHGHYEIFASLWVYYLGGMLAVFVGVGTVVRDLNGRLEDFWRSRPVSLNQWLLVKYAVGFLVVIVTLSLPLAVEHSVNRTDREWSAPTAVILAWHPFVWAALYSVAFLFACLLRRGAHAAMLALAAALLLYFLPQVIPPLRHLSLEWVTEESQFPRQAPGVRHAGVPSYHKIPWVLGAAVFRYAQLQFAGAMLLICIAAILLALAVVHRDWRFESGRKMIYWSIGAALLILFASASFQVATNLTILQKVDLPRDDEWVESIRSGGERGLAITERSIPHAAHESSEDVRTAYLFQITPSGIQLGPPSTLPATDSWGMCWLPEHPDILYSASKGDIPASSPNSSEQAHYPKLVVTRLLSPAATTTVESFKDIVSSRWSGSMLCVAQGRLYMISLPYVLTFDLSDPLKPQLTSQRMLPKLARRDDWFQQDEFDVDTFTIALLPIPELSARERLAIRTEGWPYFFNGEVWCRRNGGSLFTYRLDELSDDAARFRKAGRYDITPVQRLFGSWPSDVAIDRNFFYQSSSYNQISTSTRLTVFDIHDPQRPHPAAHFASPSIQGQLRPHPLDDGRILGGAVGHLYLLSPPPRQQ